MNGAAVKLSSARVTSPKRAFHVGLVALGGGGRQRVDRGRHALGRGLAAVLDVALAEDPPVPGRLRGSLGLPRREPSLRGRVGVVEQLAHAGLVAVEEVLDDGGVRRLRRDLVLAEALDGQRRVGAGAREARRGPEVAQQQPAPCDGGLAPVGGRQRHRGGAAQDRSGERATRRGERADVSVARGLLRVVQRRLRVAVGPGVGSVDGLLEAVDVRRARLADLGGRGALVTRQDLDPRSAQPAAASDAAFHGSVAEKASSANASVATVATRAAMMGRRRRIG